MAMVEVGVMRKVMAVGGDEDGKNGSPVDGLMHGFYVCLLGN